MVLSRYRSACMSVLALAAIGAITAPASADEAPPPPSPARASMQCDRALEPGRVRCSIEAHAEAGRSIAWADVVLVSLPDFASALKGRIAREDTTVKEPSEIKWAFGLVARRAGQGE